MDDYLENELTLLAGFVSDRIISSFSEGEKLKKSIVLPKIFQKNTTQTPLKDFVLQNKLLAEEQTCLMLVLAPHLKPDFYDKIMQESLPQPGEFPQFGGIRGKNYRGFLPTGETILFLLAGEDFSKRMEIQNYFAEDHIFVRKHIFWLEVLSEGEPRMSGRIIMSHEYVELFTTGKISHPQFSMDFPAEYISTELNDNDLVLASSTRQQINELINWVKYQDKLMSSWDLKRWIKPGYRALFHGPAGTGKTLTAMIIGKNTGRDVFRIDLSMVVSKYIGETEKNLSQLFNRAKDKDWILFFDEADALFGKRTNVRDAHDKYANQEVAYLLQRIESHNGLVILASNFKSNIDEAFMRRFQSVIFFPLPTPAERYSLWKKVLPSQNGMVIPSETELLAISKKYEITGAGIVNVVQYCCLESLAINSKEITHDQIRAGIEREYQKEGKVF